MSAASMSRYMIGAFHAWIESKKATENRIQAVNG